jgi:hypothetical protein
LDGPAVTDSDEAQLPPTGTKCWNWNNNCKIASMRGIDVPIVALLHVWSCSTLEFHEAQSGLALMLLPDLYRDRP